MTMYRYYLRVEGQTAQTGLFEDLGPPELRSVVPSNRPTAFSRATDLARSTGRRVEVLREHVHTGPAQAPGLRHVMTVYTGPRGGVHIA